METYLVVQQIVESEETTFKDGKHVNNININNIIRVVEGSSEEEAIGKFVLDTSNIIAHKKLNIQCIKLKDITKL